MSGCQANLRTWKRLTLLWNDGRSKMYSWKTKWEPFETK